MIGGLGLGRDGVGGRGSPARPPARQRLIPFVTVSLNNKAPTETLNTDELHQQKVPRFRDTPGVRQGALRVGRGGSLGESEHEVEVEP